MLFSARLAFMLALASASILVRRIAVSFAVRAMPAPLVAARLAYLPSDTRALDTTAVPAVTTTLRLSLCHATVGGGWASTATRSVTVRPTGEDTLVSCVARA